MSPYSPERAHRAPGTIVVSIGVITPRVKTRTVVATVPAVTATKHLVALRLNGRALADAIASVWSAGDAAFPVDPALPELAVERLLRAARPDLVIDARGERGITEPF